MKSFFVAMAILALLIASGIAFDHCLNDTASTLLASCEKIDKDIRDGNFKAAFGEAGGLSEYIDNKKPLLSSILDHSAID